MTAVLSPRNVSLMTNNTAHPAPTTHFVTVDMGLQGLVTIEVYAVDYATAYRGAVEALLLDPEGVLRHGQVDRLRELGYQPA